MLLSVRTLGRRLPARLWAKRARRLPMSGGDQGVSEPDLLPDGRCDEALDDVLATLPEARSCPLYAPPTLSLLLLGQVGLRECLELLPNGEFRGVVETSSASMFSS
jgi:hypothetical protein